MIRPTEYEMYAKNNNIVDRDTFLANLERLSTVNDKAKALYEELYSMSKSDVDIPDNLDKEQLILELDRYYKCFNSFTIAGIYHIILTKFNYERDMTANTLNTEPVEECVFKAYKSDYKKFIACIHEYLSCQSKWGFNFCPNNDNYTVKNPESIKVPELPF